VGEEFRLVLVIKVLKPQIRYLIEEPRAIVHVTPLIRRHRFSQLAHTSKQQVPRDPLAASEDR
jgi:hypothetical protein